MPACGIITDLFQRSFTAGLLHHDKQTLAYNSVIQSKNIPAKIGQVFGIYYELSGGWHLERCIGVRTRSPSNWQRTGFETAEAFGEGKFPQHSASGQILS